MVIPSAQFLQLKTVTYTVLDPLCRFSVGSCRGCLPRL